MDVRKNQVSGELPKTTKGESYEQAYINFMACRHILPATVLIPGILSGYRSV